MTALIETYITIHDQDLLLECETTGQFKQLGSYTYLFVGPRPVDRLIGVPDDVKVIVCRDYEPNMEHLPQFYDFTGWYVLAKHHLIEAHYAIFLQYDMEVVSRMFEQQCIASLMLGHFVAMTAGHNEANNFMLLIPGFPELYDQGMSLRGVDRSTWPHFNEWPTTQGTAWRTGTFIDFMEWFMPMFDAFKDSVWAGHFAERTVKAYLMATGRSEVYLGGVMRHHAKDCHGTSALMRGDHALYTKLDAEFRYQSS